MRRFELIEGSSNKFWEVDLDDEPDSVTVRFGRIGAKGRTRTTYFDDAATAKIEHDARVAEKVEKGYTEVASEAGASVPGERLVPDFGLDDDGSMVLDFGRRCFRVGFDEHLAPLVRDEAGAVLKALPKPNANDDPEKAKAAAATWKALKKDATEAAKTQMRRAERAMCGERRWDALSFQKLFVDHRLIRQLARRLLWATYAATDANNETGSLIAAFRIAEDNSFADVNDDAFALPDGAAVGIPHVAELGDSAGRWSDVFANYELLQPFPQLGRELFTITDDERVSNTLTRSTGIRCHFGKVLALEPRGWRRGEVLGGGVVGAMVKRLQSGASAVLDLADGGLYLQSIAASPEQIIGAVHLTRGGNLGGTDTVTFGELSPIEFSELVRDIETLR